MKPAILGMIVSIATVTAASAVDVAPASVVFTEGAVAVSLTGVAGDPVKGRIIVYQKRRATALRAILMMKCPMSPFTVK